MQDTMGYIFGFVVLLTAVGLAGWEIFTHRQFQSDFSWLHTHSRLRRRITMAILLLFVAILVLGEAFGILALENLRHLLLYVTLLAALALALLVLSIRDLTEMARNAERHAMEDLKKALDEQRKSGGSPPTDR